MGAVRHPSDREYAKIGCLQENILINNIMIKIALVLYTSGLDYDDRIRKEILTIKELYPFVYFKIFAVEAKNREETGVTSYGIDYRVPYLKSRDKYASGTHKLTKSLDFYLSVRNEIRSFDILWCADVEVFPFLLFSFGKPIIWDLHELPRPFMRNTYMRMLFKYLENKCTVLIHANPARKDVLLNEKLISNPNKHLIIRNYPQFNEIDTDYDEKYLEFCEWLGTEKCVYLQGLNDDSRAAFESIVSVIDTITAKIVVVGRYDTVSLHKLKERYGNYLEERVFFTGQIKQLKTPQYMRKCFMSLVFYKNTELNNYYCEANRFYQNILNNNPVVVGNNPPMKELVDKYKFGIAIDNDGTDIESISNGINKLLSKYDEYKQNVVKNKHLITWSSQCEVHRSMMDRILNELNVNKKYRCK